MGMVDVVANTMLLGIWPANELGPCILNIYMTAYVERDTVFTLLFWIRSYSVAIHRWLGGLYFSSSRTYLTAYWWLAVLALALAVPSLMLEVQFHCSFTD
jgi:hypothetical protein